MRECEVKHASNKRVRNQALSIGRSAPSMVIQTPSFPSGFPPPRGIGDIPRIMHDIRGCDTHAYRGALAYFNRRALPVEIPAWGEEFGARALCPCLLALGTQRARRDFQAAASPPVKVWLSGALFRLRKSVVRVRTRSEQASASSGYTPKECIPPLEPLSQSPSAN